MPPLAILAGLGSVVPERILTNQHLEAMVDTSDAWIVDTAVRLLRIDAARRQGRPRPGDTVVSVAFGAGMTYAGAAIRWDETARGGSAA